MKYNHDSIKHLLRCPKSRAELEYHDDSLVSCDADCRLRYPVIDGFPVLLIDEATAVPMNEWSELMRRAGRDPVTGGRSTVPPKG